MRQNIITAEVQGSGYVPYQVVVKLGMLLPAMNALDNGYYADSTLSQAIEMAREKHPDWAIGKCKKRAEVIMNAGKADRYYTAAEWLQRAYDIYKQHNRLTEWQDYYATVLDQHGRKYKLVPLLKQIGKP